MTIKNGILGLSAHHGIHGNDCSDIRIENMIIKDFEIGAININQANNFIVEKIEIGPTSNQVIVSGSFSKGRQLLGFLETLLVGGHIFDNDIHIMING